MHDDYKRLTSNYKNALADFSPHWMPCIYRTGALWPTRSYVDGGFPMDRTHHTVHRPDLINVWEPTLFTISNYLKASGVDFVSIDPFTLFQEKKHASGEETLCDFIVEIGVVPESLEFKLAVSTAKGVKDILAGASPALQDAEVAFFEINVRQLNRNKPELFISCYPAHFYQSANAKYRKPFSPLLGVSIARLDKLDIEGTGGLFIDLGGADNQGLALVTCAHNVYPSSTVAGGTKSSDDTTSSDNATSFNKDAIVLLGETQIKTAIDKISTAIDARGQNIEYEQRCIVEGSPDQAPNRHRYVKRQKEAMESLYQLLVTVKPLQESPASRIIGHVLHSPPLKIYDQPYQYRADWAQIKINPDLINPKTFYGKNLFMGTAPGNPDREYNQDLTALEVGRRLFPECHGGFDGDSTEYEAYEKMVSPHWLFPVKGVMSKYDEITHHTSEERNKALYVLKSGIGSGLTIGDCNGLHSLLRTVNEEGVAEESLHLAITRNGEQLQKRAAFATFGDSGASVLTREVKLVGMITHSRGLNDFHVVTYATPFWWLLERIREQYPNAQLWSSEFADVDKFK